MKKSFPIALLALLTLASGLPLHAAESFVPVARNSIDGSSSVITVVWATNTSQSAKNLVVVFIPAGVDGAANPGPSETIAVGPGQTVRVAADIPDSGSGMLRFDGPPELRVDAVLERIDSRGGVLASARLPVLTANQASSPGDAVDIVGIGRTDQGRPTSDFGVANLTRDAASCTVSAFRANGEAIGSSATIALLPLSVREFNDVFQVLGTPQIADARLRVTCDKRFTAYGLVFDTGGPRTAAVTPAGVLNGTLDPIVGPQDVVFSVGGDFLIAKTSDSYRAYTMPLEAGKFYKKATIDFDMFLNRFPPGLFTGVVHLNRPNPNRRESILYMGVQIRNDNKKTNLDLGDDVLVRTPGPWRARTQYHMRLEYDLEANSAGLTVFKDGQRVYNISGRPQSRDLRNDGHNVRLEFGYGKIFDGAYYPPYTWVFSNLVARFTPAED